VVELPFRTAKAVRYRLHRMKQDSVKKEWAICVGKRKKITEKQSRIGPKAQARSNTAAPAIVDLNYASEEDSYRALAALNHMEFIALATVTKSTRKFCSMSRKTGAALPDSIPLALDNGL